MQQATARQRRLAACFFVVDGACEKSCVCESKEVISHAVLHHLSISGRKTKKDLSRWSAAAWECLSTFHQLFVCTSKD